MAAIAVLGLVFGPATEIAKCILPPIKRQFNYLCCFTRNAESLTAESQKLDEAREGLKGRVTAAENNAEVIFPEVKSWLESATKSLSEANGIKDEIKLQQERNFIINWRSRYSLSKKAKKMAEAITQLRDDCKFDRISHSAPPAAASNYVNVDGIIDCESRRKIEDDIISSLNDENVSIIGICGMGGVGKTTITKKIMKMVKQDNLFDEGVMAVVSQPLDVLKIQNQLMEQLGLDSKKFETKEAKAHQLRTRLTSTKRILVVLDDLWKRMDLEEVGIPLGSGSAKCKVILTTRNHQLLEDMKAKKTYEMKIMSDTEAWNLFKNNVGDSFNDKPDLAKDVVKECKGLPLALKIIGSHLKGKEDVRHWEDALQQLQSANPIDMPEVLEDVYNPLKLSYDGLGSKNAKSLFLLCGVFPEDHEISLEDLTRYSFGLDKSEFERGGMTLEDIRNRVFTLVSDLKSHSLLLEGKEENHVKMHDVVRDVAIFIAKKTEASPKMEGAWFSGPPKETFSSTIRFLTMQDWEENKHQENQWNNFFEETRNLNVLCIQFVSMRSLPSTTELLKNVNMLHLFDCMALKSISIIGELTSLEILRLEKCFSVSELPSEIGRLTRLRLLEVYRCRSLEIVQPGVISSLHLLEELKMRNSFRGWAAGEETRNASLKELESLSKLSWLEIEIQDANAAAIEIVLSQKITKFFIQIGERLINYLDDQGKMLRLNLAGDIILGNWVRKLLQISEAIQLDGDGASHNLEYLWGSTYLKHLGIYRCSTIKFLVDYSTSTFTCFPSLEYLNLMNLPNLEKICDGKIPIGSNFFSNLKSLRLESLPSMLDLWSITPNRNLSLPNLSAIEIRKCHKLENLFQLSMASRQLVSLEVEHCICLKVLFSTDMLLEDERTKNRFAFPMLETLELSCLSELKILCKGAESIEFPRLVSMEIRGWSKLKDFVPLESRDNSRSHDNDSLHFFCDSKVAFRSLRKFAFYGAHENIGRLWCRQIPLVPYDLFNKLTFLRILGCKGIKEVFASPSISANLVNLEELQIGDCPEMVQVIGDNENTSSYDYHGNEQHISPHHNNKYLLFPKLETLVLNSLPKLKRFVGRLKYCVDGDVVATIELPSLQTLQIDGCGRIELFTVSEISVSTPNLEYIRIDGDGIFAKDVNGAIQQRYIHTMDKLTIDSSILVSEDSDFLIRKDGVKISVSSLSGKTILLFFGQGESRFCRDVMSKLIEIYKEINAEGLTVEVILVSNDSEEASYDEFFSRMPWLAIPFGDNRIDSLRVLFKVWREPRVVAIGPNGEMLSANAETIIWRYGARAYPFTLERMEEIEAEDDKMAEGWPPQMKIDQFHPHDLLLTKRLRAYCDYCGKSKTVWFYCCKECNFDLHRECATQIH